jgi:competence protein ComEC
MWLRMPMLPLALALGAGIAAAGSLPLIALWCLVLAAMAVAGLALALDRTTVAAAALLLGIAAIGALHAAPPALPADHVARLSLPRPATLTGRLEGDPLVFAPNRRRLDITLDTIDAAPGSGRVFVTLYGEPPALDPGQRVRLDARLHRAAGFRNPGGFDYGRYLERQGVFVVASGRADRLTVLEDPGPSWNVTLRRGAREAIERALPPASAALLTGLLLGERTALPPEIDTAFRRAGVYHLLAVSGFNVALIAGATFTLLNVVRFPRRLSAGLVIVVVVAFAAVVGPQASVLRAAIMATLVLGALLVERDASVLNALALSAIVILAVRPGDLHDPGFQLSFAATIGIVLAPLPRGLVTGAVGVSLAAEAAVLPVTLVHFNQVSLVGPLANLFAVPLAGVATVVGLAGVAAGWLAETAGDLLLNGTWPALLALRLLVAATAAPSWALVHLPAPSWPAIAAYVAALLLALAWWHLRESRPRPARRARALAICALVAALTLGAWPLVRPPDGRLRVIVLDVGQGDAIVVETPEGPTLLVDAGGGGPWRLDAGERVVAPVLWNRGTLRLRAAVTTHDDQDHAGGMRAVRALFTIAETWTADGLREAARDVGGVRLTGMGGLAAGLPRGRSRNDDALVLRIDHGLVSLLLASDVTAATEARLVASGAPLRAAVLKVAHHGSRGSSTDEFLRAVSPQVAVISVGARNAYGHPAPETLARLDASGAAVYRTDRDGAVILESDGRALTVRAWATGLTARYCLDPAGVC